MHLRILSNSFLSFCVLIVAQVGAAQYDYTGNQIPDTILTQVLDDGSLTWFAQDPIDFSIKDLCT
jgi:hypothetical protein